MSQDIVTVDHENTRCCLMAVSKDVFNRYNYNIDKIFKKDYNQIRKILKKDGWYFNYKTKESLKDDRKEEIDSINAKLKEFNNRYGKEYYKAAASILENKAENVEAESESVAANVESKVDKAASVLESKAASVLETKVDKAESVLETKAASVLESKVNKAASVLESKEVKADDNLHKSRNREKELEELLRQRDEELMALKTKRDSKTKKTKYSSPSSQSSPSSKSQSSRSSQSEDDFDDFIPPKKQQYKKNQYKTRNESSVISTISPQKKTNKNKKMDESIVSPPKRNNKLKMKKVLSDFNEDDDEDEDEDSRSPSPKYKTKNPKKLEFYKLLQKISNSVKTYSGTTNSDSSSDSETDSSNRRSNSRSYLSSDSSSDGYPSPKRVSKQQPPPRSKK